MQDTVRYSAPVSIYLIVKGKRVPVAACLENRCQLRNGDTVEEGAAELVIKIDGNERRKLIYIERTLSQHPTEIEYRCIA